MLSEYNNNGHKREITARDKEFSDKKYIKALLRKYHEKMKADYEAQTKIYKKRQGGKESLARKYGGIFRSSY